MEALKSSATDQTAVAALDTLVVDQDTFSKINSDLKTKVSKLQAENLKISEKERDASHQLDLAKN